MFNYLFSERTVIPGSKCDNTTVCTNFATCINNTCLCNSGYYISESSCGKIYLLK
jgi:hypothetical protein